MCSSPGVSLRTAIVHHCRAWMQRFARLAPDANFRQRVVNELRAAGGVSRGAIARGGQGRKQRLLLLAAAAA